jgi:hypothetical protein
LRRVPSGKRLAIPVGVFDAFVVVPVTDQLDLTIVDCFTGGEDGEPAVVVEEVEDVGAEDVTDYGKSTGVRPRRRGKFKPFGNDGTEKLVFPTTVSAVLKENGSGLAFEVGLRTLGQREGVSESGHFRTDRSDTEVHDVGGVFGDGGKRGFNARQVESFLPPDHGADRPSDTGTVGVGLIAVVDD